MKILLVTDHSTILQLEQGPEFARFIDRVLEPDPAEDTFSVVGFHEQALGCQAFINRARAPADLVRGYGMLSRLIRCFARAPVLPFDPAAVEVFDDIKMRHLQVGTMDLRIAAIALSRDLILLTRNVADFVKVPGLQTEDWTR